jgi:hypothetical protein
MTAITPGRKKRPDTIEVQNFQKICSTGTHDSRQKPGHPERGETASYIATT